LFSLRHLWCWDIDDQDIYIRGGPIFTCARCGTRTNSGVGQTIFLTHKDFNGMSRAEAEAAS